MTNKHRQGKGAPSPRVSSLLEAFAWLCLFCLLSLPLSADDSPLLDIYFEESHAGSFYHLAEILPLEEPHTLVLVDAHSDASAIANSDAIREAIRKVPSTEARAQLFARWRKAGTIQCFDWIEPLLPAPFERVLWVSAPALNPIALGRAQTTAREYLDGMQEAFPRACGLISDRYHAVDWTGFEKQRDAWPREGRVVVSLDLDYFASIPDADLDTAFEHVFAGILKVPGLRALTISLSAPWLRDDAQREHLVALTLDAVTAIANSRVHFAPFAETGEDRSLRAIALRKEGKPVPRLDLPNAGSALRSLLVARRDRLVIDERTRALLDEWATDPFLPQITVDEAIPDPDGWFRLPANKAHRLVCTGSPGARVRWFAMVPEDACTNVAGLTLGFAEQAPRWLRRVPRSIGEGPELMSTALHSLLEPATHAGTAIVFAAVEREGEWVRSKDLRLAFRVPPDAGRQTFRAALSEGFARPYAFGCGLLEEGPDGLIAADCANFVIAGLRRDGWRIPWSDPKQFATHCQELAAWERGRNFPPLPADAAAVGTFIHFGSHVAALWEDRPPIGQLDEGDLVAHHLEGLPEIVPLGQMLRTRERFRMLQLRPASESVRLVFGGDVMLGRKVGEAIDHGAAPLAALAPMLSGADFAFVNLECTASPLGAPLPGQRYHFRAHAQAPALLAAAGLDAVAVANNHTHDFGEEAFADAAKRLRAGGVKVAGDSTAPVVFTQNGARLSVFACYDEASEPLLATMRAAAEDSIVVVMAHWGTEHSAAPSKAQRELATKLIAAGARIISGSGPHCRQPMEFQDGALVAWSLGNLVFDGPGPDAAWSHGALLDVTLTPNGRVVRARELRVRIGDDGTAKMDP